MILKSISEGKKAMQSYNNTINYKLNDVKPKFIENMMHGLFITAVLLGVLIHFSAKLPATVATIATIASIASGFMGLVIYMFSKSDYTKMFFYLWIALVIYMLFIGLINSQFYKYQSNISVLLNQDIRYVMYFAIGIAYADKLYIEKYNKLMIFLGFVSILFALLALLNLNLAVDQISERQGIWTIQYYYWWLSCSIFAYLYPYTQIMGKYKFLGYGVLLAYGGLGLIFLKRSALINVIFIILITIFLKPNKKIKNSLLMFLSKIALIVMLIMLVFFLFEVLADKETFVSRLFNALFNRFSNTNYFENFNRTTEAKEYLRLASPLYKIFGQGMGKYAYTNMFLNSLHTGFFNLIYKGGIFYLAFYLIIIFKTLKAFINRSKLTKQGLVCLCTVLSSILSLAYEFSWSYTIVIFGYATSIAFISNLNYKRGGEMQ